jgi:hypothetical protein
MSTKTASKTIGINMHEDMAKELTSRAESMHLSVSKYCKLILAEWVESGRKLNLTEE